ncbi:MAG: ATP-binding protein [Anaerolineae bacterium]|nr:ATP-binding protein [Anaerolineae bacterium]
MPNSSNAKSSVCPICRGVGFFRRDVPVDHPDFGRAIPCECKIRETQQSSLEDVRQKSGLGHLPQMTFETFRPDGIGLPPDKRKNLRDAYDAARAFAENPRGWLLLKGGLGCGKTHLAAAIANACLARGIAVLFVVVPDLLDHLRATFAPTSRVSYDDRFENIRTVPCLILDDLGTQATTAWAQEKLFQLFNYRYNAQLPTVVTTNRELEEIDPRVRSRLADTTFCKIVTILAPDFRQGGVDTSGSGMSNLALYGDMTFENFDLRERELKDDARTNLRRIFYTAQNFAENPQGFLVLTGDYGCGKTHLAAAIANEICKRGGTALFVVVPDLLDHLRATFAPGSTVSYDQRFDETRRAPVLVLDDLGTENATPWAREKLFQIIDYRYVAKLPTIITIHREAEIDARIQSRIFDLARSSVNEILAPSYRTTHRRAQTPTPRGTRKARAESA